MVWNPGLSRFAKALAVLGLMLGAASAPYARAGDPVTLDKPLAAEVFVKTDKSAKQLRGNLLRYDDAEFTLRVGKDERTLAWADITPASAVALRQKTIDRTKAEDWLALGAFAWHLGAKDQAQSALRQAVRLKPDLKSQADEILATPPNPPQRQTTASSVGPDTGVAAQPGAKDGRRGVVKFTPATPEQAAAANAYARQYMAEVSEITGVTFQELETDHFLIFTDWDKREYDYLKKNLERAYAVVARQFDMDPKETVFVGKLPVYMFSQYDDFAKLARSKDEFPVTNRVAGYFRGNTRGLGHMSMWKPTAALTGSNDIRDAERLWSNVLVHEFTHAFLARYRSDVFIPRWLNEGCAEVIAQDVVPLRGRYEMARLMALQGADVMQLFDDRNIPSGEYYPVMQTMVELLVQTNRKSFLKMIDAIKDGADPAEALQEHYNVDYATFAKQWREYAKRLAKN